jgi:hypothetical protein
MLVLTDVPETTLLLFELAITGVKIEPTHEYTSTLQRAAVPVVFTTTVAVVPEAIARDAIAKGPLAIAVVFTSMVAALPPMVIEGISVTELPFGYTTTTTLRVLLAAPMERFENVNVVPLVVMFAPVIYVTDTA